MAQLELDEFVSDDRAQLEQLVRRTYRDVAPWLRTTLQRLTWPGADVEDMLHDVFVVALRRRTALATAGSPRAWLYGVAVKVASDRRRRHALWSFLGLDEAPELAGARGQHEALEQAQAEALLQRGLAQLTANKREVFVLFELDELSGQEIAEALGCPLSTVWNRLHQARKELVDIVRELTSEKERP
jgi:RNA polymerase sigma-70 factor (ECF subfamily)